MPQTQNSTEPLGLPRGSVRAILTVLLILIVGVSLFVPVADGADGIRTGLVALAGIAVRDYFGGRERVELVDGPPLPPPVSG